MPVESKAFHAHNEESLHVWQLSTALTSLPIQLQLTIHLPGRIFAAFPELLNGLAMAAANIQYCVDCIIGKVSLIKQFINQKC